MATQALSAELKAIFSKLKSGKYYRHYELKFENGQPKFVLSDIDRALDEAIKRWCGEDLGSM